jgi:small GTP-binding protein
VGKSTLFNRLTKTRDALVADFPGLTRDRRYGLGRVAEREFLVVDTAGFDPVAKEGIVHEMAKQAEQAIAEADALLFMVDARNGLTPTTSRSLRACAGRAPDLPGGQQGRRHEPRRRVGRVPRPRPG